MQFRIGIVGSAGTGKSTTARVLAEELGLPFLSAKEITDPILQRDGYDFSSGMQIERFLGLGDRQREILYGTINQQLNQENFVTDRTFIDLAAYAICEQNDVNQDIVAEIHDHCRDKSKVYTHLFVCPWKEGPLGNNGRRTLNPWYQFMIHCLDIGVLQRWNLGYTVLGTEGVENRVREIKDFFLIGD
jgi:hypothetical protein